MNLPRSIRALSSSQAAELSVFVEAVKARSIRAIETKSRGMIRNAERAAKMWIRRNAKANGKQRARGARRVRQKARKGARSAA